MSPHFPIIELLNAYDEALNVLRLPEWPEVRALLNTDKGQDAITALSGYAEASWGLKMAEGEEFELPRRDLSEEERQAENVRICCLLRDQNDLKNQFRRTLEALLGNEWIDEPLSEEDAAGYLR